MAAAAAAAASAATLLKTTFSCPSSPFSNTSNRRHPPRLPSNRAVQSAEPGKEKATSSSSSSPQTKTAESSSSSSTSTNAQPSSTTTSRPKKPVYSMKKGQIVRVDKEKYLNSVNYLSVGHPPYYKGLDYIYEDRGEVLDLRIFDTGEYALVSWVGIPTAPAWLPTDMLIKSDKLDYERL